MIEQIFAAERANYSLEHENYFPLKDANEVLLPAEFIDQAFEHLGVKGIEELITLIAVKSRDKLGETTDHEEIWDTEYLCREIKEIPNVETKVFTWGTMVLGFINLNGTEVPTFYLQDACPVGFYVSTKYQSVVDSLLGYK